MSGQTRFDIVRTHPAGMLIAAAYGGGINTIAGHVWMHLNGYTPTVSLMANPGAEDPRTLAYAEGEYGEWADSVGFPRVTVVTRKEEARYRPRAERFETLYEECRRINSLPSAAYGFKKCSLKYKRDPALWWFERQAWAHAEWDAGRRIVRFIGYDAGEHHRVMAEFGDKQERARFLPWYPLLDEGYDRPGCVELIRGVGLKLPPKSACEWCPNLTIAEWRQYASRNPAGFADTVQWSREAAKNITSADVVGFLRRAPNGQRQLHVWADAGMPRIEGADDDVEDTDAMPCECST